ETDGAASRESAWHLTRVIDLAAIDVPRAAHTYDHRADGEKAGRQPRLIERPVTTGDHDGAEIDMIGVAAVQRPCGVGLNDALVLQWAGDRIAHAAHHADLAARAVHQPVRDRELPAPARAAEFDRAEIQEITVDDECGVAVVAVEIERTAVIEEEAAVDP